MDSKLKFLRFIAYGIEIVVLYILSGTPGLMPEILGVKPVILIPVALTIAAFEGETPSMIFGLICGALCDTGTGTHLGFYAISLTVLCFIIGYCARNFFVTNFINATIIGVLGIVSLICLHYLIFCVFTSQPDLGTLFIRRYLVRILYTLVFLPPLYWFNRIFCSMKND